MIVRALALCLCVLLAGFGVGRAETTPSFSLKPLSAEDARAYAAGFAAVRAGDFDAAEAAVEGVKNPLLQGRLAFLKLMHANHRATYEELAAWLVKYRDQPEASCIYALAKKRQPNGADSLPTPQSSDESSGAWARVEKQAQRLEASAPKPQVDKTLQAAREAFYGGEIEKAYALANQSGERWIGGLAAYRLKRFDEARTRFAELSEDMAHDDWARSGAAYWAARAAIAAGAPEEAPQHLAVAARTPYTFYGLIAERQLGLEPAIGPDGMSLPLDPSPVASRAAVPTVTGADGAALARLVRADNRAARAVALAQIGQKAEAGLELRTAMQASSAETRALWTKLGLALNVPLTSPTDLNCGRRPRFDIAQYPTPELQPHGGFTLDRALVYALVRQESRFNANATSSAGAYGLMQLMPATAARVSGDNKLAANPSALKDPALNLRLGQDYVGALLNATKGDLLHAVAAYNSGPGVILKTLSRMGKDANSLLAIESMPGGQTREFVERVMAGYWIYRNLFGQDLKTLDAAASSAKAIHAALDRAPRLVEARNFGPMF